jgi:hypothetical protein
MDTGEGQEMTMARGLPFTELKEGWPVWSIDCDDPQAAQEHDAALRVRRLPLPGGEILAVVLRIYDVKGRPQLHHLAGPLDRPEIAAWARALRQKGGTALVLERHGWATVYERRVNALAADLIALDLPLSPGADPEGSIRRYLDRYRAELPKLHQPEAVWDAMLAPSAAAAPKRGPSWLWALLALAAAGAAAWYFLPH